MRPLRPISRRPRAPLGALLALACAGVTGCNGDVTGLLGDGDGGSADARAADGSIVRADLASPDLLPDPSGPPYPIVLVHGMAGFRNIGPIDYFYGVPDALRKDGHDVWVSQQDPINDSEVRGQETLTFVQQVLSMTGKRKVNLVGHSQGGFDVRYVASSLGTQVASVMTIASPMDGDPIADLAQGVGPAANDAIDLLLNLYGALNGYDSDAKASISQLTTVGARAFFARHPDAPGVDYYSLTGRSASSWGAPDCSGAEEPLFVARWDGQVDVLSPLLGASGAILNGLSPRPVHDGLVTVASARHGVFLGCIPADHMEEVHQLLGAQPGGGNTFDAIRFYRDLADWLVARGY